MTTKDEPTYVVEIHIAGDLADARHSLRRQCLEEGLCVTVVPEEFVYTAGMETGVSVALRNYPRFPSTPEKLWARAERVATRLMDDLCQHSALIVGPERSRWLTRRPDDLKSPK